jgi:predicted RNase H-like HicB family nuclease
MEFGMFPIAIIKDEDDEYFAINLALEDCSVYGETLEEAIENIKDETLCCLLDECPIDIEKVSLHMLML